MSLRHQQDLFAHGFSPLQFGNQRAIGSRAAESNSNRTRQQTKSQNTRNTILDAAIRGFYRFGYNNTTTEKIANEAGVPRAMLHHFRHAPI
jgi:hypothetical protein